jgi:rubrerythrin
MADQGIPAGGATVRRLGDPWCALTDQGCGYLSVYFSEPLARWPVREITRPGDNKSDPNIETATYGLFSTCEPGMRNRIVHDGAATVFFLTTHKPGQGRVLSGYYHLGWYTEGTQGAINRDYALAASSMRFIDPIAVQKLPGPLAAICSAEFRTMKPIDTVTTSTLRELCDRQPAQTASYLDEVKRIENFARARTSYAYPSWGREEGFTWDHAPEYYQTDAELSKVPNSSKNKKWRCGNCGYVIKSGALLKKCPLCKEMATLAPTEEHA